LASSTGHPVVSLTGHQSCRGTVAFVDAVHPTHAVRPVGCWAPQETLVAVEQSSGRNRLNIHGAIDLETGQTIMKAYSRPTLFGFALRLLRVPLLLLLLLLLLGLILGGPIDIYFLQATVLYDSI
jgi:hypothetical protein